MSNQLEIKNLSFMFKGTSSPIFSELNFDFNSNDTIGIYGYNGSGKTTLLNCLSGYYKPTKGNILLNNLIPDKMRKEIAIIRDEIELFDYLNLENNIRFYMNFYNRKYYYSEVDELLDKYNMLEHKKKYVFEASKGMLKKIQIIISLLLKPKLLLADEPLNALDEESKITFWTDVKSLKQNYGTITVLSLHNKVMLKENCNQIIYL